MSTSIPHSYNKFAKPDEDRLTYGEIIRLEEESKMREQKRMMIAKKFAITAVSVLIGVIVYENLKDFSMGVKSEQAKVEPAQNKKDKTIHAAHYHMAPARP